MKPFKIVQIADGRYLVFVEGEEKPLHVEVDKDCPHEQAMHEIADVMLVRQTRKRIEGLSASLTIGEDILFKISTEKGTAPPATAEALISLFTPKRFADAQLGDMQEMFENNVTRFGLKRAKRLYWYEVVRSAGPWLKRIGFIAVLVDYGRRKMGL